MQHRLNARLTLWLLVSAVLAAFLIWGVHEVQLRRNLGALLRQAGYAVEEGDFKRASSYLDAYLSYPIADVDALANYGIRLEKQARRPSEHAQACDVFERVLQRDPERHDIRHRLVWTSLTLHRLDDARKNAELLLPHWANKAELHHIIAWCQNGAGEHEEAVESYARAIAADPKRIEAHLLRAAILDEELDRAEEAEAALNELVAANSDSYRAYVERARYYLRRGRLSDASNDIVKAESLAPNEAFVVLTAMEIAQAHGDSASARALAEKGRKQHPEDARFCKAAAGFELRTGNRPAGIKLIEGGLQQFPGDVDLAVTLADLMVEDGRLAEAKQVLGKLKHNAPEAKYIAAGIAYGERRWSEAIVMLEKLRKEVHGNAALGSRINTLLGFCYERVHAADQRAAAFERALVQDPDMSAARAGLAAALIEEGRLDQAITALETMRSRADASAATLLLLARAYLMRLPHVAPDNRNWADIEALLAEAAKNAPSSAEPIVLRAEMMTMQNQHAAAEKLLQDALMANHKQTLLWCATADLAARERQFDKGLKLLDEGKKSCGDQVDLRLARARLLLARGAADARNAVTQATQDLDSFEQVQQLQLLRGMAELLQRHGAGPLARNLWQKVAELQPHDVGSRQRLFELAIAANQFTEAEQLLHDIRSIEGESIYYLHGLAALAVQQATTLTAKGDKLKEAKKYLLEVNRRRPDWPQLPLLQARIAEMEGDTETAINRYLAALDRGERQPEQVVKLVRLLCERRRFVDAERALRQLEDATPLNGPMARLGAEIALRNHDNLRAINRALQAVRPSTNDYRDLLWLAEIFSRAENDAEAEKTLRRAVEVGGHVPDTWVALCRLLAGSKRRGEAAALLAALEKEVPKNLVATTVARCQEALGDLDLASTLFDQAVTDNPRDVDTLTLAAEYYLRTQSANKAAACLQTLIDPAVMTPGEQANWARRELAVLLAERGGSDNHRASLTLLQTNRTLGHNRADERALLYVKGLQTAARPHAIESLLKSFAEAPATVDEQFRLLRLYEEAEQSDEAKRLAVDLLLSNPRDTRLLAHRVRRLIDREQFADAQIYLERLMQLEPKSARVRQLELDLAQARTVTSAENP